MQILTPEQLSIPKDRMRKQFTVAALTDLKNSIKNIGLMHPIVVRDLGQGNFELVAGERRMRAIRELNEELRCNGTSIPAGHFPTIRLDELSPIQRLEAELHENILREELTWQEKDAAQAALHALRVQQNPSQTIEATAKEIAEVRDISTRGAANSLTRATVITRNLHRPEVNSARSSSEAYRIITSDLASKFEAALAEKLGKEIPHEFLQATAQEALITLPSLKFDCIIADPPYGIRADEFGDAGGSHEYDDSPEAAQALWHTIFKEGYRVTKEHSHMYFFCDILFFNDIREMGADLGWQSQRTPIIWSKGAHGHDPIPGIGFKRTYELFCFFFKGKKPAKALMGDILQVAPSTKVHAAAKPVELYSRLLARSCIAGDSVLDPCCGSGTIFPAASQLNLKATGIEPSPAWANICKGRLYGKE